MFNTKCGTWGRRIEKRRVGNGFDRDTKALPPKTCRQWRRVLFAGESTAGYLKQTRVSSSSWAEVTVDKDGKISERGRAIARERNVFWKNIYLSEEIEKYNKIYVNRIIQAILAQK